MVPWPLRDVRCFLVVLMKSKATCGHPKTGANYGTGIRDAEGLEGRGVREVGRNRPFEGQDVPRTPCAVLAALPKSLLTKPKAQHVTKEG